MMTEPDVTLTDYLVALESALFAYLLVHDGDKRKPLRLWFAVFFGSISVAAFTGGTVHGFFLDMDTLGYRILWPLTLAAIGVTAMAAWIIGARICLPPRIGDWVSVLAVIEFAAYCLVVLLISHSFSVVVMNYIPAVIFLTIVFGLNLIQSRERKVVIGLAGLLLTFVAAWVQQGGLALHPKYFNHNALYHLIQAVALYMIFWTARWWVAVRSQ